MTLTCLIRPSVAGLQDVWRVTNFQGVYCTPFFCGMIFVLPEPGGDKRILLGGLPAKASGLSMEVLIRAERGDSSRGRRTNVWFLSGS